MREDLGGSLREKKDSIKGLYFINKAVDYLNFIRESS